MSDVLELLSSELSDEQIRNISAHLGTDHQQTQAAISAAIPTLVSAMGRAAETDEGSVELHNRVQALGDGSIADILGSILGKQTPTPRANHLPDSPQWSPSSSRQPNFPDEILPPGLDPASLPKEQSSATSKLDAALGGKPTQSPSIPRNNPMDDVLGKVLGNKQKRVEETIGKSSGMDMKKVGPLLVILAPIILSALKSRATASSTQSSPSGKLNPGDLSDVLRRNKTSIEQKSGGSLIGRMLDQDGDGDFDFADMVQFGMSLLFPKK